MFKNMAKTACVALMAGVVGLSSVAATPAMAQGSSAFGLQFGVTSGDNDVDGTKATTGFFGFHDPYLGMCLTNAQVRSAVADRGYSHILLNVPNDEHIQVKATKGGTVYLLDFNFCTNKIEGRQALRAAQ